MKTIVVLLINAPNPEVIGDVLDAIDPTEVPYFAGKVWISVEEYAQHVIDYLEESGDGGPLEQPKEDT